MPPTPGNGKICYVEIPAMDVARSADFYRKIFGWNIMTRGDGNTAFDDGVGQVSGSWVLGRPAHVTPGLMVYVMVSDVAATLKLAVANGGEVTQPIGMDPHVVTARFRDPGGNVIGLYQE